MGRLLCAVLGIGFSRFSGAGFFDNRIGMNVSSRAGTGDLRVWSVRLDRSESGFAGAKRGSVK